MYAETTGMGRPEANVTKSHADGVLQDHQSSEKSAWELVNRLRNLKNQIFGPEPEAAQGEGKSPSPSGFFPRLEESHRGIKQALDEAHNIIGHMETRFASR